MLLSVLACLPATLLAAEVYSSVGADGAVRYATQPLDNTYRLLLSEPEAHASKLLVPVRAGAQPRREPAAIQSIIDRIAKRHGLPVELVSAVASVESNFSAHARSSAGAGGVMQLMPATARQYGLQGSQDWRDPVRNIDAGVRHLKDLLARYEGNVVLALSAYNAGSGAVGRHRDRIPPYRETMLYVPAVLAKSASISAP